MHTDHSSALNGAAHGSITMAVHRRRRGVTLPWTPPFQTKGAIVGKNETYKRENLIGPFLVYKLFGPRPPPTPHPPPLLILLSCRLPEPGGRGAQGIALSVLGRATMERDGTQASAGRHLCSATRSDAVRWSAQFPPSPPPFYFFRHFG